VEYAVAMLLVHFGMDIETRVAELGDLLSQQFDPLRRVAEYDRLIYLQLSVNINNVACSIRIDLLIR